MQVVYTPEKMKQQDTDGPIRCSSLTLVSKTLKGIVFCTIIDINDNSLYERCYHQELSLVVSLVTEGDAGSFFNWQDIMHNDFVPVANNEMYKEVFSCL
jgi:hypothetical protein